MRFSVVKPVCVVVLVVMGSIMAGGVRAQTPNPSPATPAAVPPVKPEGAAAADTVKKNPWKRNMISRLSGTQIGYRNWAKGGDNSLAITIGLEGNAQHETHAWINKHDMRLAFGIIKQDTINFRKADDLILINSSLQYKGQGFFGYFNPIVANQIRTQFARGYNYKKDPYNEGRTPPVKVSELFNPLILSQSVGLTYDRVKGFTSRLGMAAKETIVPVRRFRPLYGVKTSTPIHWELGLESRSNLDIGLVQNVRLRSSLGVFMAFNNPSTPDVIWESLIAMKVNKWLGVNFEFDTMYDTDLHKRIQLKEVLALSVSVALI